jgi:hypothetical protein
MQQQQNVIVSISMPVDLARQLDLLAAHLQAQAGPIRRISRSAAVRAVLERHLADSAPAAPIAPSRAVRVRRRKPDRS